MAESLGVVGVPPSQVVEQSGGKERKSGGVPGDHGTLKRVRLSAGARIQSHSEIEN